METPRIVEKRLLKKRVLYRQGKTPKEGIIEELSPSEKLVRISDAWFDNQPGLILEILPALPSNKKSTRSTPTKR